MMKRFLLPPLTVAVLAGFAKAGDASTATAWKCTSQTSGPATYVIDGNDVKKRDNDLERYEACQRKHPASTPGPDGKISAALPTDPCEPVDLDSYTFRIELNNPLLLIAVSPAAGRDNASTWVAKRMIIIDKHTGSYDETLLSTPTLPPGPQAKKPSDAGIAGNENAGTCDVKSPGNPNLVSNVLDGSQNPDPVVEKKVMEEEQKPQKKSDTRVTHVHAHRHHRHGHRDAR